MLGTAISSGAIFLGGYLGLIGKRYIKETTKILQILGICLLFLSAVGFLADAITIENGHIVARDILPVLFCLAAGTGIGQAMGIEKMLSEKQDVKKGALYTGFILFGVGGMQLIGPIQSFVAGDNSILFSKAIVDFVLAIVFGSYMGRGIAFSAVPVGIMQIIIGILAMYAGHFLSDALLCHLRMIGYLILFFVGFNLLFDGIINIKTGDMLPAPVLLIGMHIIGGVL